MKTEKTPLNALVIEDVEDDALLLVNELKRGGYQPSYSRVDTPELLTQVMLDQQWDVVFCDYSMPKMDGGQALDIVRQINQDVPFIFVSGTIGEDVAVEAMRTGAQDYIMKGNLKRLAPAVKRELSEAKHRKKRREVEKRLHFLANYDSLTKLPNRIQFHQVLNRKVEEAKSDRRLIAVAHLNIDRFKTINNNLGYKAGDLLLAQVARRLSECVSTDNVVARLAADEFAILLPQPKSREAVAALMEKILAALEKPFEIRDCKLRVSASLGVALYPYDASNANDLVRNADIATNRTKDGGGKGYRFYSKEMAVQLEEQLAMEHAMRKALEKRQFMLHYQPQVDLQNHRITGVEALVRWRRFGETIAPDKFIPLAEETGLIVPLGEWVLREACAQAKAWRNAGLPQMRVAINVAAPQFHQCNLSELVMNVLAEYDLDPSWLELEVTESGVLRDPELTLATLKKIQEFGVTVSLDDFGTGYSSFSNLKHLQVDNLKIDRTFIKGVPDDPNDAAITRAVIAMANKLNIKVIAEGVETSEQYDFLRAEGCHYVQGYYLGRPAEAEHIEPILQKHVIKQN